MPTIGIGADCAGELLALYDMPDIYPGKKARFVRNFMQGASSVAETFAKYVTAVKDGNFPSPEHTFSTADNK